MSIPRDVLEQEVEVLREERKRLLQVLRTLRKILDGSQPIDVPGAVMVIDFHAEDILNKHRTK